MALQKLRDHFNETPRAAFMKMLDQKVHVVEKLAASSFDVQRGDMTNLYFKSNQAEPMSIIDRTIVKFYESVLLFLVELSHIFLLARFLNAGFQCRLLILDIIDLFLASLSSI